ncbi:ABC transporter permease subunit [Paenibacillus sp. UMB4589-SE434]|uniref:ABC transporter permease subunit n=1 Tax=Paenibacillus sp. UMB4589-SE434 TaxID=3046314 RepID=UPI00254F57EC|nr:ABC transporter permease subunit [Paenibacillus sp. UMB4589-SE434]MDK8181187.1 ABC transporter permease [Paenibacillus sp. UMB4589-SE434]
MRTWFVLYQKECKEMLRNYKWIWVPLVFAALGIAQPVTMKFMPDILSMAGSLPEGSIIKIPLPVPGEVLGQTLSQFNTVGLLVLVLALMGAVSGELKSGTAAALLIKPVSHVSYMMAKWAGAVSLTIPSVLIGYLCSWYYTEQLIGHIDILSGVTAACLALGWFIWISSLTVAMSSLLNHAGGSAFAALAAAMMTSILSGLLPASSGWMPSKLLQGAQLVLMDMDLPFDWPIAALSTLIIILVLMAIAVMRNARRSTWLPASHE